MRPQYFPIRPPYFKLLHNPSNREEKRLMVKEVERVLTNLFTIDAGFLTELFGEKQIEYQHIFTKYNTQYKDEIEKLNRKHKFKLIKLDKDYFYNEYKPLI